MTARDRVRAAMPAVVTALRTLLAVGATLTVLVDVATLARVAGGVGAVAAIAGLACARGWA